MPKRLDDAIHEAEERVHRLREVMERNDRPGRAYSYHDAESSWRAAKSHLETLRAYQRGEYPHA